MDKKISIDLKNEPLILSKITIDRLFKIGEDWADAIALYLFYYKTAKWQNTTNIKAVTSYVMNGTGWTEKRVQRIKKLLIAGRFIEDVIRKDDHNRIIGHFIQVNFFYSEADFEKFEEKSHPVDFAGGGESPDKCFNKTNSLNASKKLGSSLRAQERSEQEEKLLEEIHQLKQLNQKLTSKIEELSKQHQPPEQLRLFDSGKLITKELFETFWKLYPNKKGKTQAKIAWEKLCTNQNKANIRPTWRMVRMALKQQRTTVRWKTPEFIPHATTWINQQRWLENIEEMNQVFEKQKPSKPTSFGYTGSKVYYRDEILKM